jgi:glycyl-tRNA synthetase
MSEQNKMEKIISLCKRRGFIYPGSEIYGGLAGTYDYGPRGAELKKNIKDSWWQTFVQRRPDIYGVDAAILMNSDTWEASGHVEGFHDPLVEDTVTKKRYRADHLLEDNGVEGTDDMSVADMDAEIHKLELKSPDGNPLGSVQQFNMMLATQFGANQDTASQVYLRPETAQGIFTNYKNVIDSLHPKLPFGIAQIGKAFRNEITPRDYIFRQREFEQMEIQYFIHKDDQKDAYEKWKSDAWRWLQSIGLNENNLRWHDHTENERAHYAADATDIQYQFDFGFKELHGIHNRTDFDLSAHQNKSGQKLEYFDQQSGERFIPYVIEASVGIDRTVLALLTEAYYEEDLPAGKAGVNGETRVVLKLEPHIAPVKMAVLPLMKKNGLTEKAKEVFNLLIQKGIRAEYDETGSIGKRYRRQDEIGTPQCITIDFDTLEDDTVTIRDRDTLEQTRVKISELKF